MKEGGEDRQGLQAHALTGEKFSIHLDVMLVPRGNRVMGKVVVIVSALGAIASQRRWLSPLCSAHRFTSMNQVIRGE